ncbi:MAG: 5-oxoprolinase subunit PxpB [Chloroflexota bacterium]
MLTRKRKQKMHFKPRITALGDSAVLIQLGEEIDVAINQRVHALAGLVEASAIAGVVETVPAYATLLVHYDPLVLSFIQIKNILREKLTQIQENESRKPRLVEVPVQYGGELGPDLELVASHLGLRIEDVIRIHSEKIYTVHMMGFTPGYPYMGKLDDALVMPRLETPRTRVPAGTVAIAGSQTGIYSIESPGGWNLIGWTLLKLFDPNSDSPFLFAPGDEVKFIPVQSAVQLPTELI